ncbi:hypothetical protein C3942_21025 [Solimonas fluminis]|uniref:GGDEF-domain containing protein n=1 Tax=Solimonas fluminis TaxID=2086571 RepID=A0A2S5TAM8_9GAMM|nr:EAL domain-containing protein [Solimonas fluminis]PPE71898.1 hypothetical protein C3942_21025 [Solimonas fluminis]
MNTPQNRPLGQDRRLEGLNAAAGLLRSKTNRYAWYGLGIALLAIAAATLLAARAAYGGITWEQLLRAHAENPALWLLDAMPLLFLVWGQYIGTVLSYQASAMLIDETTALREQTTILQHELERSPVEGHTLGLPNRHAFISLIGRALTRRRVHGLPVAVMTLASEQYHETEQSQGRDASYALVNQLTERLKSVLGENDVLAHFGHDDFGILLPQVSDESEARRFASRLQFALDTPITVGRQSVGLRVSVGIALAPEHGEDAETLIRHAEIAKYAAAGDQRDYRVYEADLDESRNARPRRIAELHAALYNDGLADDYMLQQPLQAELPPRVRLVPYWNHPRQGRLEEAEFLNLPDRLSLVHSLTLWQFREGLARLAQWRGQGRPGLGLVIRVPDAALRQLALADMVTRLLGSHDLPPAALTLEVTEAALVGGGDHARGQVATLRGAGVGFCVTGAGQPGSSALTSLYFPVNEVRLSPLPLQRALTETPMREAFDALLSVLRHLRQGITLGGVDSPELLALARAREVAYLEGQAVRARMRPEDVERWLGES